jgi:DNA repair exonuclease SbcCD ATPase subunit
MTAYGRIAVGLLIVLAAVASSASAQDVNLADELSALQKRIQRLEGEVNRLERTVREQEQTVRSEVDGVKSRVDRLEAETGQKVSALDEKVDQQRNSVNDDIGSLGSRIESLARSSSLYLAGAVAGFALLVFGSVAFFRWKSNHSKAHIEETRKSLEERWLQTDAKLVELLERELTVTNEVAASSAGPAGGEPDHSLQLKVADEIVRIHNYLSFLDPNAKGVKHLAASVKRIEDNLEAEGYEIPKMLNKPYDQGMKVVANFKVDESLGPDEYIITRIIKPAVNYKGVMIQAAEIEVSHGE